MAAQEVFETTFDRFNSNDYLQEYYSQIGHENSELLQFFAQIYKDINGEPTMLEFGGGPTVYQLISAAPKVKEIHFADYLDSNLQEVKLWQRGSERSFNWRPFIKRALTYEGINGVNEDQVTLREELIRKKISRYLFCNAFQRDPIDPQYRQYYDLLSMNFVTESITYSKEVWKQLVANVCSMVKRDGSLVMTAIKEAVCYRVNGRYFPAVGINEIDIEDLLASLGFNRLSVRSTQAEITVDAKGYHGYEGFIFVNAQKVT